MLKNTFTYINIHTSIYEYTNTTHSIQEITKTIIWKPQLQNKHNKLEQIVGQWLDKDFDLFYQ